MLCVHPANARKTVQAQDSGWYRWPQTEARTPRSPKRSLERRRSRGRGDEAGAAGDRRRLPARGVVGDPVPQRGHENSWPGRGIRGGYTRTATTSRGRLVGLSSPPLGCTLQGLLPHDLELIVCVAPYA